MLENVWNLSGQIYRANVDYHSPLLFILSKDQTTNISAVNYHHQFVASLMPSYVIILSIFGTKNEATNTNVVITIGPFSSRPTDSHMEELKDKDLINIELMLTIFLTSLMLILPNVLILI